METDLLEVLYSDNGTNLVDGLEEYEQSRSQSLTLMVTGQTGKSARYCVSLGAY